MPRVLTGATLAPTELETKTFSVSALLDSIRKGKVRIPRFQRGFRWTDEDRRLLFDSLQSGFPIGTLLLARGEAPADRVMLGGFSANVPQNMDTLWVVDGQQRLVTLAMALLEDHAGAYRPLFFDLEKNTFVIGTRRRAPPPYWIPTHVLPGSAALNKWLREARISEELSDRADSIASRVREYLVPAYLVPYNGQNDQLLQEIFARVNRGGRALEKHEVFQALHSSVTGGKGPLTKVHDEIVQLGFGELNENIIQKTAIAVSGGDPRLPLQEQISGQSVPDLFERVSRALALTIEFLVEDVGVPHITWLPYEGVVPALARFLAIHPTPHVRNRALLIRWFWRGTLTRDHRTDNSLDRPKWNAIDEDEHGSVQRLLKLLSPVSYETLPSVLQPLVGGRSAKRFTQLISLASLGPKVLVGEELGQDVPIASLLEDQHALVKLTKGQEEEKTLASHLIHPPFGDPHPDISLLAGLPEPLLASHALDPTSIAALQAGDEQTFLTHRSDLLLTHLRHFLAEAAGFNASDHDRQPLDAYFTEEGA